MKKYVCAYLVILFIFVFICSVKKNDYHKVVKIVSPTAFYVDFNDNMTADINELVIIDEFEYQDNGLPKEDSLRLRYLAKQFAKNNLLNKSVKVLNSSKTLDILFKDKRSYIDLLKNNGFVLTNLNKDLVIKNIDKAKSLDLVVFNKATQKYHKLDCSYVFDSTVFDVVERKDLSKNAEPCKLCHVDKLNTNVVYPRDVYEQYLPIYKDNFLEFYITDFTKYYYPSKKCLTTACKSLLREIKQVKKTIDFAIYGIDNQPEIVHALIDAQKRGVVIRWVYDTNKGGSTIYSESLSLANVLKDNRRDIDYDKSFNVRLKDSIMHNKFFIFDNKKVWTGSANISHTDLSGFNANSVLLIDSEVIADFYTNEFEKMFNGRFHTLKSKTPNNMNELGKSKISVYFSPQDNIIENNILPLVNNAQKYVYIPVFVVTHKGFNQALVDAVNRGVDVRLIVDATSASSPYSAVKFLRTNGIKVKIENRAGKMHMKSMIVDDKYSVIGSMNFTKSGNQYNDENVVIIDNKALSIAFRNKFLDFWQEIPEKWLFKNPMAESIDSINSCFDGVDNDFDGDVDENDSGCFIR